MKRKPKVEAWAAVFSDTGSQCEQDSVFFEKESAAYVAKLYDARPTRVTHLVPADPRRDAELRDLRRVAKAAARWVANGDGPSTWALERAIEKMQRGRK